jgi:hypothetical protein
MSSVPKQEVQTTATRYPIRVGARSAPLLLALGATRNRAWVDLDGAWISARFGFFRFRVPVEAVTSWRVEGPWRWITAIGVRRSIRGGDMSFAGSPRGGVRLDFDVPRRWGPLRVPAFYLGVDDLDGFGAALAALGIPGEDARRRA